MFVSDWHQEEGLSGGVAQTIGRVVTAVATGGISEVARVVAQNVAPEIKKQMDAFNVGVGTLVLPDFKAISTDIGQAIEHPLKAPWLPVQLTADALVKPELKGLQTIGNAVDIGGFKPVKFITNLAIQPIAQTEINLGDRPGRTLINIGRAIPSIVVAAGTGFAVGGPVGGIVGGGLALVNAGKQRDRSDPNLVQQTYTGVGTGLEAGGAVAIGEGIGAASAAYTAGTTGTAQGSLEIAKNVGAAFVEGAQGSVANAPVGQFFGGLSTVEKAGVALLGQSALSMATPQPKGPAPVDWSQAAVYDTSANAAQGQDPAVTPPPPPGVAQNYGTAVVVPPPAPAPGSSLPPVQTISTSSPLTPAPQQPTAIQAAVQAVQAGGIPATAPISTAVYESVGIGAGQKASNLINLGPTPLLQASSAPATPILFVGAILALLLLVPARRRAA